MTQQPFSRPGAIDLSALQRPAAQAVRLDRGMPVSPPAPALGVLRRRRRENFKSARGLDDRAGAAGRSPRPAGARERARGRRPGDAWPTSSTAASWPASSTSTPRRRSRRPCRSRRCRCVVAVVDGRPAAADPGRRCRSTSCGRCSTSSPQQLTAQGITGRHQPRAGAGPVERRRRRGAAVDPRYAAAQDALGEGDIDRAVAEYQKLVDANPADAEAAAGLAMAKVLQRTQDVDLQRRPRRRGGRPRRRRRPDPGRRPRPARRPRRRRVHPPGRRSCGVPPAPTATRRASTCSASSRAVGNDDPRVLAGRQNLASALF